MDNKPKAVRDRVAEIARIKRRGRSGAVGVHQAFRSLRAEWDKRADVPASSSDDFFIIRAVTLLEVLTRAWVADMIDQVPAFSERAIKLPGSDQLKFDPGIVRAIQGRVITFGDIYSHHIQLNSFGNVCGAFTALMGEQILHIIETASTNTVNPWEGEVESDDLKREPIVPDTNELYRVVERLFEIRHVLCHELPGSTVYEREEIGSFLRHAESFAVAIDAVVGFALFGHRPQSMVGLKAQANAGLVESERLLTEVYARLEGEAWDSKQRRLLKKANKLWSEFRDAYCEYRADLFRGGTGASLFRTVKAREMTEVHTNLLMKELDLGTD